MRTVNPKSRPSLRSPDWSWKTGSKFPCKHPKVLAKYYRPGDKHRDKMLCADCGRQLSRAEWLDQKLAEWRRSQKDEKEA